MTDPTTIQQQLISKFRRQGSGCIAKPGAKSTIDVVRRNCPASLHAFARTATAFHQTIPKPSIFVLQCNCQACKRLCMHVQPGQQARPWGPRVHFGSGRFLGTHKLKIRASVGCATGRPRSQWSLGQNFFNCRRSGSHTSKLEALDLAYSQALVYLYDRTLYLCNR